MIQQGIRITALYFCFRGSLDVLREADGEQDGVHLTTLGKGSFFGEQSFLAEHSRQSDSLATATVEAATYCELETLPFKSLRLMMAQEPELLKAIKAQARAAYARNIQAKPSNMSMTEREDEHKPSINASSYKLGRSPTIKKKTRRMNSADRAMLTSVKAKTVGKISKAGSEKRTSFSCAGADGPASAGIDAGMRTSSPRQKSHLRRSQQVQPTTTEEEQG